MSDLNIKSVFDEHSGAAKNYRIPSMIVTKSGVLVSVCDSRYFTGGDNPNRIEKVIRRSFDSGETWEDMRTIVAEHGDCKENSSSSIDAILTYNEETNRIIMVYSHTPAGIGILNSNRSVGVDSDGGIFLNKGKQKFTAKNGRIYTRDGVATEYTVNDDGDYYLNGELIGNYNLHGLFEQEGTFYLMMSYSDDDGATWSKPQCLNNQVKKSFMSFLGAGPGAGITLKNGKFKGRMVFPIYFGTRKFPLALSCAILYTDDNGNSWHMGISPNDTRKSFFGIRKNSRFITEIEMLTEAQVIELDDGTIRMYMRNHALKRRVAVADSTDGGVTFHNFRFNKQLPHSICQQSVIRFKKDGQNYVVFVNPNSEKYRINGTVRVSLDDGETFPYARQIKEGEFVYSCLAILPDGNIGLLFEGETSHTKVDFTKFSLEWVMNEESRING